MMTAPDLASTSPDSRAAGIEMFASAQSGVTPEDAEDLAKVENDEMNVDDNTRSNKRGRECGVRKPHEAHGSYRSSREPSRQPLPSTHLVHTSATRIALTHGQPSQYLPPRPSASNRYADAYITPVDSTLHPNPRPSSGSHPPGLTAVVDQSAELEHAHRVIAVREKEIRKLQADNMTLVEEMQRVRAEWQTEVRKHEELKKTVESFIQERNAAAAQQLTVNTFDSSLDRVSEGQLVGDVEALNNSISELVMDILEKAGSAPSKRPTPETLNSLRKEIMLVSAAREGVPYEGRELLVEAVLHRTIIRDLYPTLFQPKVASAIIFAPYFEKVYNENISKNETWKISQRWRAVTAKALDECVDKDAWETHLNELAHRVLSYLAIGLKRSPEQLHTLFSSVLSRLVKIWDEATRLALAMRHDCTSVQLSVTMKHTEGRLDETVEIQWESKDMPREHGDRILGTYAFGVQKKEESGKKTTLLRTKVVTDAVRRYVVSMK